MITPRPNRRISATARLFALLSATAVLPVVSYAQPAPPPPQPVAPAPGGPDAKPVDSNVASIDGKIVRFTTAPQGEVDGAVLDNGTSIHWPPHLQDRFAKSLKAGDAIRASGRADTAPAGEKLFEVKSVTNVASNSVIENPDFNAAPPAPPAGPGPRGPGDRRGPATPPPPPVAGAVAPRAVSTTVEGRVQRYTIAPGGETDGALLDNGSSLHWPPHLQDQFKGVAVVGGTVRAVGRSETGPAGDTHVEVQVVTNTRTNAKAENPDFAAAPPVPGEPVPAGAVIGQPAPAPDLDQRIRNLQSQVDQLKQELASLKQAK